MLGSGIFYALVQVDCLQIFVSMVGQITRKENRPARERCSNQRSKSQSKQKRRRCKNLTPISRRQDPPHGVGNGNNIESSTQRDGDAIPWLLDDIPFIALFTYDSNLPPPLFHHYLLPTPRLYPHFHRTKSSSLSDALILFLKMYTNTRNRGRSRRQPAENECRRSLFKLRLEQWCPFVERRFRPRTF